MILQKNEKAVVNIYDQVNSVETAYQAKVENQKIVKKVAFLSLGLAGMGATAIGSMLLGQGVTNLVPNVTTLVPLVVGSLGIGGVSSVMALTTSSFMNDSIIHAESDVKKAYASITPDEKNELLANRKNLCSSIANLRAKHLVNENTSDHKFTQ